MPSYGNFVLDKGYDADLALLIYRGVKAGVAAESVTPITVAGEFGLGIAQFAVLLTEITRGKGATIRGLGISEWEAGGVIARGAFVTVDNVGRCVTAVATNNVWGQARQAASGAGVRISVELTSVQTVL